MISAQSTTGSISANAYSDDLLQYEWPQDGQNEGHTKYSDGPAPDTANVLWTATGYGNPLAAFNGKIFTVSGTKLYALDYYTGSLIWTADLPSGESSGVTKLNDEYLVVDTAKGIEGFRISDGAKMWSISIYYETGNPGSGHYHPTPYSNDLKIKYICGYDATTHEGVILAYDLSDPSTTPPQVWSYVCDAPSELLAFGDGKLYVGTTQYTVYALDGEDGSLVWTARKMGFASYWGTYSEGKLYASGASTHLTCYNTTNGDILWDYDAGGRGFFAHSGAIAYGRYFQENARPSPCGYVASWDADTGDLLWQTDAWIRYGTVPALADGKLYYDIVDTAGGAGDTIAGQDVGSDTFACIDAWTGEILWTIEMTFGTPIIAYGNLYATSGTTLYCFGSPSTDGASTDDWSYFRGNIDNPGVAIGQIGPSELGSGPIWTYSTDGAVTSSPVIVDGKLYIGSNDKNIYCINARTGTKIWNFTTGFRVASTPAVVGGRVYTGADDGNIYCLDAATGEKIWEFYAGGQIDVLFEATSWQPRSSPIVIGNLLYVGALDGKVYCLTTSGTLKWSYQTDGPIGGSPAYDSGTVYIVSADKNLYALDATTGTKDWNWTTPKSASGRKEYFMFGTPTIAEGKVFIGGGGRSVKPSGVIFVALNATTGALVWQVNTEVDGNSNQAFAATYYNGVLYLSEHNSASARNATTGELIWLQWLGFQVSTSAAYADDIRGGKVYYGCDSYAITCINATSGTPLSVYTTEAQVSSSPAIWDGKLYVGSGDGKIYCFSDVTDVNTDMWALSDKGLEMWSNETVTVRGQLRASVTHTGGDGSPEYSYPGLPNATVTLSITKPDQTTETLTTATDNMGYFTFSYNPTQIGDWGWVAYYEGQQISSYLTYNAISTQLNTVSVVATPGGAEPEVTVAPTEAPTSTVAPEVTESPTTTTEPTTEPTATSNSGIPMEYIYAIVAVIVIVVIAVAAYIFTKKK